MVLGSTADGSSSPESEQNFTEFTGYSPTISLPLWRIVGDYIGEGTPDKQYFENLLSDCRWSDVIIINQSRDTVGPTQEHRAHHLILGPASLKLDQLITESKRLRKDGMAEIVLDGLPNAAIRTLIEYIYTGNHTTSSINCTYLLKLDSNLPLQIEGLREYMIHHGVKYIVDKITQAYLVTGDDYNQRTQGAKEILIILEIFEILWYSLRSSEERELCRPVLHAMFQKFPRLEANPTFINWWNRHKGTDSNIFIMERSVLREYEGLRKGDEDPREREYGGDTWFHKYFRALTP
ncbi:hypothetical protein TWF481_005060 [Arthrobotrys musiformis]|uniref:BTB domain-containing protein n=1 Tax=Arthrobotrys musiformis TaxID=47236 RepID=A0AAV9WEC4_9PEZI